MNPQLKYIDQQFYDKGWRELDLEAMKEAIACGLGLRPTQEGTMCIRYDHDIEIKFIIHNTDRLPVYFANGRSLLSVTEIRLLAIVDRFCTHALTRTE